MYIGLTVTGPNEEITRFREAVHGRDQDGAANAEMKAAIHKLVDGCKGMSAEEAAETETRVNAYYAAFRAKELQEAAEEELCAAEDRVDPVDLERRIRDAFERYSSSPIAGTQDGNSP
jgi:hypothetical protein